MERDRWGVFPTASQPPKSVLDLAAAVESDGGSVLGLYQEPVGNAWQLFALVPLSQVQPTPYQRDLSPTHAKRLKDVIKRLGRFIDPIVVVRHGAGDYWNAPRRTEEDFAFQFEEAHFITLGLPYVKNFVMARVNPLTRARLSPPLP